MDAKILTPKQLIDRWDDLYGFRKTERTLGMWRHQKKGPKHIKPFGRVLYRIEDVEEWERNEQLA